MVMHDYLYAVVDRLPRAWSLPPSGIAGASVEPRAVGDLVILRSRIAVVPEVQRLNTGKADLAWARGRFDEVPAPTAR